MSFSLLPKAIFPALTDITAEYLEQQGIALLMLDFDNTIVPYTTSVPTEQMAKWLYTIKGSGIKVCIVSNSHNDRVPKFCRENGLDCITHAKKPFSRGIRACLDKYGMKPAQAALVGDQIFTDTLGGNCAGVTSILVSAIDNHNIWLKLRHVAELPFILLASQRSVFK